MSADIPQASLWHLYQKDADNVVFWDSATAPLLTDAPEFLHTRQTAPTGVAYEMDVTGDKITISAADVTGSNGAVVPDGAADLYYFFLDDTAAVLEAAFEVAPGPVEGVQIEIVPAGTLLSAADKSLADLQLELELPRSAVLVRLGAGTPLDDASFKVVVRYERTIDTTATSGEDEASLFEDGDLTSGGAAPLTTSLVGLLAGLLASSWLFL